MGARCERPADRAHPILEVGRGTGDPAGGRERDADGFRWVEDEHGVELLPDTWAIARAALARARNLRAVVVECERNPLPAVLPLFTRVAAALPGHMRPVPGDSRPEAGA